jgi:hypothetical protein
MITTSQASDEIRRILQNPAGGFVGLVDDLLTLCVAGGLQMDWRPDRCRVRTGESDWEELSDVTLRKSVFRAVLARVATLCNEFAPDSVSPYGGTGQLVLPSRPGAVVQVGFVNTPDAQELRIASTQA